MEGLEVMPGSRGGIRQPKVGEGIGHQQVAVLIIDSRLRDANPGQQKGASG